MKVVIAGSTGFVGSELIRQALVHPDISSVIGLGRREAPVASNWDSVAAAAKFQAVALKDFGNYTDEVKDVLAGADAVIWTIAITPATAKTVTWEEQCKISRDYAINGIRVISQLPRQDKTRPLRFIYMSGNNAERDPAKKPRIMGDVSLMRGDAENQILSYAKESGGVVEACVAKPGVILSPDLPLARRLTAMALAGVGIVPNVQLDSVTAVLLDSVVHGFKMETFMNEDLVRDGEALRAAKK